MPTAPAVLPDLDSDLTVRRQPPYAVLIHNDDFNGQEFVARVLQEVFRYPIEKCVDLMLEAHDEGCAVVWRGAFEVAELKADLITGYGPDPKSKSTDPIRVSIEPVE
jgi:ATP-dependent Clp protease adaptor protein ClpS